jgi:hypothetical protein
MPANKTLPATIGADQLRAIYTGTYKQALRDGLSMAAATTCAIRAQRWANHRANRS